MVLPWSVFWFGPESQSHVARTFVPGGLGCGRLVLGVRLVLVWRLERPTQFPEGSKNLAYLFLMNPISDF